MEGECVTGFPPDAAITNSPITKISYRRTRRLRFLFAALRTRSLSAREELARIATNDQHGFVELLDLMRKQLAGQQVQLTKNRRRLRAFVDLAWLVSNQPTDPPAHLQNKGDATDAERAQLIYRWAINQLGFRRFQQMHHADALMLGIRIDDAELMAGARRRLRSSFSFMANFYPRQLPTIRALGIAEVLNLGFVFGKDFSLSSKFLKTDADNPFRAQLDPLSQIASSNNWLRRFSDAVLPKALSPLILKQSLTPFDSLAAQPPEPVIEERLITVVVSCYKPKQALVSSVSSILASSYQNLEVLVIDDASGVDYAPILTQVEALDLRVRVLTQLENGGTYRIRNRALDQAKGQLITFHDSDDWMHPQRLAMQERRLRSENRIANISMSTRVTDNLEAVASGRRLRIGLCEPSLMFKREAVKVKIGYFDVVRKGADSEYRKRIEKYFNQELEVIYPFKALTLQRADHGGLTDGELSFRWIVDFRLAHRDAYNHWHKTADRLFIQNNAVRDFYAPRPILFPSSIAYNRRTMGLVIAANFCDQQNVDGVMEIINKALREKKTIAFWQLATMYPLALTRSLRPQIIELLNSNRARMVYSEDKLEINRLLIAAPSAYLISRQNRPSNWQVRLFETVKLEDSTETWVAKGNGLQELIDTSLEATFRPQ